MYFYLGPGHQTSCGNEEPAEVEMENVEQDEQRSACGWRQMYSATKQEGGGGGSAECEQMEYEIRRDNDHNGKADNIFHTNPSMIPARHGRRVPDIEKHIFLRRKCL